ncbi:MAG: hypothetical protein ACKVH8_06750 [Pirellulales bacterium]
MWTETGNVWGGVCVFLCLVAATSLVLRVVSRLMPDAIPGTGTATNELMRHILFVLLLTPIFDIPPIPLLSVVFVLHSISMLVSYRMPWLLRSLTKSATAIGLLNVLLTTGRGLARSCYNPAHCSGIHAQLFVFLRLGRS